jgi:hypothetical protein
VVAVDVFPVAAVYDRRSDSEGNQFLSNETQLNRRGLRRGRDLGFQQEDMKRMKQMKNEKD